MHRRGAARLALAGLLMGGLFASGATPAVARPHRSEPTRVKVVATVAPGAVTVGEPATLNVRVRPAAAGVRLQVQRRVAGRWVRVVRLTTRARGRAVLRLDTDTVGTQRLRVVRPASRRVRGATSKAVVLTVVSAPASCTPRVALVDSAATAAARCLAARLDRWKAAGGMGVGQQLNVSNEAYAAPLTALGRQLPVVGLDLKELADGQTYGFPVPPLDHVKSLAQQGAVLSVSWHPDNPGTGGAYHDRSWTALPQLLSPTGAARDAFWSDFDAGMQLFLELQESGVAVVFRPLHEANGDWFWWGHPDATTYRQLWTAMQQRAAALGVHNVLWAYSFNADTGDNTTTPVSLLPSRVDLAGMDSYSRVSDPLSTAGYAAVAARVSRMAFTEVGPYETPDGSWDPAKITTAARSLAVPPIWSMLWFDDSAGIKQLSSLSRGRAWLSGCPDGFCTVAH